ncbi:MAG: HAD family phosphatase [Kiritimatiellae bacterium]|nr:HAD family phosphatase [Kiritimatiellia bacterium]
MRYAGAIFDQDGLLFDTEITYQRAWVESARRQGVEVPSAYPRNFCGLSPKIIAEMVRRDFPALDVPLYCKTAIELAWSAQLESVPPRKKGLMEMLSFCRENGIKTAVASSSARAVVEHNLTAAGVRGFFCAVATGDEVENGKPAPDIFLLAAARLGLEPRECCVFEDAFSGIRGASAAGCGAVLIPDQNPPTDEIRAICRVFGDLEAAIAVFGG